MIIRDAILAAASHIERNPGEFDFMRSAPPSGPGCGSPGCAAGWIGAFHGSGLLTVEAISREVLGLTPEIRDNSFLTCEAACEAAFYNRMDAAHGTPRDWMWSADLCAAALRAYADRWHPAAERPIAYPNWQAIATAPLDDADAAETLLRAAIKERRTA